MDEVTLEICAELAEAASTEAIRTGRSASEQLEHWVEIGRALEGRFATTCALPSEEAS